MDEGAEDMDAQAVEVDGQETDHSETCHLGRDQVGSMDAVRVGIWGIVQVLALLFLNFLQVIICKPYRIKRSFLRNSSRIFRIVLRASRNDCQKFKNKSKIPTDRNEAVVQQTQNWWYQL